MVVQRLKQFIDFKGIKVAAFEAQIGMSNASFGKSLKNNGSIGADKIEKILSIFPELSAEWLLKGIDPMINDHSKSTGTNQNNSIPLIPIEAVAGRGAGDLTIVDSDIEQRYVIPEFHKADFLIRVKGNSMYPKYSAGDILACIRVGKEKWSYLKWNTAFVLDTDIGVMVKRILKSTNKKEWILRSDNKEYQDIEMPITSIYGISMVMGVIRFE